MLFAVDDGMVVGIGGGRYIVPGGRWWLSRMGDRRAGFLVPKGCEDRLYFHACQDF